MEDYTKLFVSFLNYYGFEEATLQDNKRLIFKMIMEDINPSINEKELNKLTSLIFHLSGCGLQEKRESFRTILSGKIVSSYNDQRIFLFDSDMTKNHLSYYIEQNPSLSKSFILLFFNGINLVSIHINEKRHLDIVHKQLLYQVSQNSSLFTQNLFNVLCAEGQLYFGPASSDLSDFNHIQDQAFHTIYTNQMVRSICSPLGRGLDQAVKIDFKEKEDYALTFKHLHLILSQVWSLLSMTYLLKGKLH